MSRARGARRSLERGKSSEKNIERRRARWGVERARSEDEGARGGAFERPMVGVARRASVWSCALRAGGGIDDDDEALEREAVERAARELRARLLDEVVRGTRRREKSADAKKDEALDDERVVRLGDDVLRVFEVNEDEKEADVERMKAAVAFVLGFCAEILQPANGVDDAPTMPPLGTHVIRRKQFRDDTSVYFQEQCSFDYDTLRTADHFMDYSTQCVFASAKVQILPRVSMCGPILTVHFDQPTPLESAAKHRFREGCYVELRGCSGHPDYLRKKSQEPPTEAEESEIFEFNLPSLQITGFARGYPIAELIGEVVVSSKKSGLKTSLKFREFDVETSPSFRNIVSGAIVRDSEVKRLILGTWDTRVLLSRASPLDTAAMDDALFAARDFGVPPLTTATGVRSLMRAFQLPGGMSNRRLWQSVVEALRVAELEEPELSIVQEVLDKPATGTSERIEEGKRMGYELALIVAESPPPDAAPPLPRYWFPGKSMMES